MIKVFEYKGFIGSAEMSREDDCLYGKIEFIDDLVSYEADTPQALEEAFHEAVDDHIATREKLGWEVHKSASGTFNVRVGPELHRAALIRAKLEGVSLNEIVKTALKESIEKAAPQKAMAIDREQNGRFVFEGFRAYIETKGEALALPAVTGDAFQITDFLPLIAMKGVETWKK